MRLRFSLNNKTSAAQNGFTLVEMLVIVPIALLAIATIISVMVALVGDVLVARTRASTVYELQDTLTRIESDSRLSTAYLSSYFPAVPQGRNDDSTPFNAPAPNNDLIFNMPATTTNPYAGTRDLVYYDGQPNACSSGSVQNNKALSLRVVYFTKDNGDGTKTLWRRTIVPSWTLTAGSANTVCAKPWQRGSCSLSQSLGALPSTPCQTYDEKMLSNLTDFTPTYFDTNGAVTTDIRNAASISVSITQTKQVAGESVAGTSVARVSHVNGTTDTPPTTTPVISVYNLDINTANNPILTSFTWSNVQYATYYSIRYNVNNGAWVSLADQKTNTVQITAARPNDVINLEVTPKNDMGSGPAGTFAYTKPIWTIANLVNGWSCYVDTAYSCPSYTLTSAGVLVFKGLVAGGTSSVITTLPAGLRPDKSIIYTTFAADNAFARIDVNSSGTVEWKMGGNSSWLSLDAVRFLPANIAAQSSPVSPTYQTPSGCSNAWKDYTPSAAWNPSKIYMDSVGRTHMYGLASWPNCTWSQISTNGNIFAVPSSPLNYQVGTSSNAGVFPANSYDTFSSTLTSPGYYQLWVGNSSMGTNSWVSDALMYYGASTNPSWTNASLVNGWVQHSTTYAAPSFTLASDKLVTIRGMIRSGNTNGQTLLFTLPQYYKPRQHLVFLTAGFNGNASPTDVATRIDIYPTGEVKLGGTPLTGQWLSLSGISFYAEQ